ncbi:hypothetical protein MCANUF31_01806 [Mycoplasmopsis canis UF31]|uniref:hypothetical protein n=1 Tax=Mycoplasmopsis canis TaxID=29555 RepID=UPI00025AEC7A|nr:hypothetical protein [Mycoplasmopsis canis]EIE39996.1 hypothetical protein MCANUF31_01806 [Mycoplasmopsis canis UF31]
MNFSFCNNKIFYEIRVNSSFNSYEDPFLTEINASAYEVELSESNLNVLIILNIYNLGILSFIAISDNSKFLSGIMLSIIIDLFKLLYSWLLYVIS